MSFAELLASFRLIDEDDITPEELSRRAEADADVQMRIMRLKGQGLFFGRPIYRKVEPGVKKAHWDYLLQEMAIIAEEMGKARRNKALEGKKYSRAVERHFEIEREKETRQEKEEEKRLKRIASNLAKDVIRFWKKIEKVANLKKESKLKEIKSAAMDKHLDFIVGETEKYSVLLAEKLTGVAAEAGMMDAATSSTPTRQTRSPSAVADLPPPNQPEEDNAIDDEEAEEDLAETEAQPSALADVMQESGEADTQDMDQVEGNLTEENDGEFVLTGEQEEDDEGTLDQEEKEQGEDHKNELDDLNAEANIPLATLLAKYGLKPPGDAQVAPAPALEPTDSEDMNTTPGDRSPREIEPEEEIEPPRTTSDQKSPSGEENPPAKDDEDYQGDEELDDETTIAQEEDAPPEENAAELDDLQNEANIPIEELLKMYNLPAAGFTPQIASSRSTESGDYETTRSGRRKRRRVEVEEGAGEESDQANQATSASAPATTEPVAVAAEPQGLEPEKGKRGESEMAVDSPTISSGGESGGEQNGGEEEEESEQLNTDDDDEGEEAGSENQPGGSGLEAIFEGIQNHPQDSTGFGEELENAATVGISLQPTGHTRSTTKITTEVPFLIKHPLREYQIVGLNWLATMYEKKLNGILADEMGLGKTIQTISLLAHLAVEKHIWGPHLIVVPTAVLLNWEVECMKWCPAFKVLTYYGSIKERKAKRVGWNTPNSFHICITSYKLVMQDHAAFRRKKWQYLILDEAQHIKNFKSQRWQSLLNFNSERRLLLTGTPLQNNLMELWSLMHFLMPNIFESHKEFQEWFSNPVNNMIEGNDKINHKLIQRLHTVLRPFLLRRLKKDVEKQLPNKFEHILYCRLSKRQGYLYDEFMSRSATKETLASVNFLSILNCLMQLRKVCCHPDLFEVRPIVSPFWMEPLTITVPTLALRALHADPFSTFPYPTAAQPPWVVDLAFLGLRFTSSEPRSSAASSQGAISASLEKLAQFLHDTPAAAEAPLLIALKEAFPDDHAAEGNKGPSAGRILRTAFSVSLRDDQLLYSQARRQHSDSDSNGCRYSPKLLELILSMGNGAPTNEKKVPASFLGDLVLSATQREEQLKDVIDSFVCVIPGVTSRTPRFSLAKPRPYVTEIEQASEMLVSSLKQADDILHSSKVRMETFFPDKRLLQYDCGKLQKLDELLKKLKAGNHRALIFSQMTKMLNIFEVFLSMHGYRYLRLDGTTKVEQRQQLIERFNSDPRYFVFILSTRSGGVGINLTGADTVIFYDSDWNPAMDAQAQDRCHRIGQTRDVHIYRLITEHTIEENILRKANQKRLLDDVVIQGGTFTTEFFQKQMDWKGLFGQRGMANEFEKGNTDEGAPGDTEASSSSAPSSSSLPRMTQVELEQALTAVEDETDVQAMRQAKTEISQELADFDPDAPIGEPSGVDDDDQGPAERNPSKGLAHQHDEADVDQPIPDVTPAPVDLVDQEYESMLGPIERYALRIVETHYPNGLTVPQDAASAKKTFLSPRPPAQRPAATETESGEATPVESYPDMPFLFSETPQRASQLPKGWRGKARTRAPGKTRGILQTPSRRGEKKSIMDDYLSGKEPRSLKAKEQRGKGKKRGKGGWRGKPRPGMLGTTEGGSGHSHMLSLDPDEATRDSGMSTPLRDADENDRENEDEEDEEGDGEEDGEFSPSDAERENSEEI